MTAPPGISLRDRRILLLDDEPFTLRLLALMLEQLGCSQVVGCGSGAEALEQVHGPVPVGVIFLDLNMPQMDGVEFIRKLVTESYSGGLVLVSGEDRRVLDSVEKLAELHHLHVLGVLPKPVSRERLALLISGVGDPARRRQDERPAAAIYEIEQLRDAIHNGELSNYYQPKVAMASGEVVGVESLVRWQRRSDEIVPPDQFISQATEHGIITELTLCVLRTALQQAHTWQRTGLTLPVAVNVSMEDLSRLDFPDAAAELAAEAGVDPQLVTLEIPEGRIVNQSSTTLDVLSRLRLKRFRLAIDDFGTGSSSLAQLRDLPFDELKIDRSFVHDAEEDEHRRAICHASLHMAHQLQMYTVAEGIEDEADWRALQQLSCDAGQGYMIARPMPAANLPGWISAWEARWRRTLASA